MITRHSAGTAAATRPGMRSILAIAVATAACTGAIDDPAQMMDAMETPKPVDIEGPAVLPHVQEFADLVCGTFDACTISTYAGHSPTAERAIDILVSDVYGQRPTDDNVLGDAVAAFALARQLPSGITYVIWRQRIDLGAGWKPMEDRGSITQNHYDHVHISFEPTR
jgi:hypothetical protein